MFFFKVAGKTGIGPEQVNEPSGIRSKFITANIDLLSISSRAEGMKESSERKVRCMCEMRRIASQSDLRNATFPESPSHTQPPSHYFYLRHSSPNVSDHG